MFSRLFLSLLGVSLLMPTTTYAQTTVTIDNTEYRKKVLKYLSSDYFITEGVGLKNAYIGQTTAQLIAALGQPATKKKQGLFTGLAAYTFQLDNETVLQAGIKNDKVQAIALAGNISSQYTTIKGVRFEMTAYEVMSLYGSQAVKKNSITYSKLGIRFDFKNNKLRVMRVFPPKQ